MNNKIRFRVKYLSVFFVIFYCQITYGQELFPNYLIGLNWDNISKWDKVIYENSSLELLKYKGISEDGIKLDFCLNYTNPQMTGKAGIRTRMNNNFDKTLPITFFIKIHQPNPESDQIPTGQDNKENVFMSQTKDSSEENINCNIILKFIDKDGSIFTKSDFIKNAYKSWNSIVVYLNDTKYEGGGDSVFGEPSAFEIDFLGKGKGEIIIDEIGIGKKGLLPGLFLDPYRESEGIGFQPRRAEKMIPEDPAVLEYLEVMQDSSTKEKQLLPNMDGDAYISTFNNSLVAMAFILKEKRERAERILDFYASAVDKNNLDLEKQNFFYKGEARGFYQHITLPDYKSAPNQDRWMGDMAWLWFAYKLYEKRYNPKPEYIHIMELLKSLLISYFKTTDCGGFVQHGWRKGDKYLHENGGHHEGNIDCYAVFKMSGDEYYAGQIKKWLDCVLAGSDLPLDLYTWRTMAFGKEYKHLLDIPDYDFRFRKTISVNNSNVTGFIPFPDIDMNNFWPDGIGHIAAAYQICGENERGFFYSNQLDALLIQYKLYGKEIKTLPYTLNHSGGYEWVNTKKGFVSAAAWYIIAKNGFNPLDIK
jgi:hypothetical protein